MSNFSKAATLRWKNPEYRKKLINAHKGQTPWNKDKKGLQVAWNKGINMWNDNLHPMLGKKHSDISIKKMSLSHKGHKHTDHQRKQISKSCMGKPCWLKGKRQSAETKNKIRISVANRILSLGYAPGIDKGATEYFNQLNKMGYNIVHPNVYVDTLGYFVDGYDPIRHIVFEFDTPIHLRPNSIKKDLIRQNNIINYYKIIGKPLKGFIRINETGMGEDGMIDVLKGELN